MNANLYSMLATTDPIVYLSCIYMYIHVQCNLWLLILWSCDSTELEEGTPIINWSSELADELGGYLYPLWNRTAGDCLLDSVLQATWGVVDRDGTLRRALADSLVDGDSL